jgi:crossover junction endodeoxyribonuclease RuvC
MLSIAGIDPGKSGAIAVIDHNGLMVVDCPTIIVNDKKQFDERGMARLFKGIISEKNVMVFMELVHAMPGQGVVSMFSFGQGYGIWLGILACCDVSYELVTPQTWKRHMLCGISGKDNKAKSVIAAKRLFPECGQWKKKDHNRADALLIAEWGRRKLNG